MRGLDDVFAEIVDDLIIEPDTLTESRETALQD